MPFPAGCTGRALWGGHISPSALPAGLAGSRGSSRPPPGAGSVPGALPTLWGARWIPWVLHPLEGTPRSPRDGDRDGAPKSQKKKTSPGDISAVMWGAWEQGSGWALAAAPGAASPAGPKSRWRLVVVHLLCFNESLGAEAQLPHPGAQGMFVITGTKPCLTVPSPLTSPGAELAPRSSSAVGGRAWRASWFTGTGCAESCSSSPGQSPFSFQSRASSPCLGSQVPGALSTAPASLLVRSRAPWAALCQQPPVLISPLKFLRENCPRQNLQLLEVLEGGTQAKQGTAPAAGRCLRAGAGLRPHPRAAPVEAVGSKSESLLQGSQALKQFLALLRDVPSPVPVW